MQILLVSFHLRMTWFSLSFLSDIFGSYKITGWNFFPPSAPENVASILASMAYDEKTAVIHIFFPKSKVCFLFHHFQNFYFVFNFQKFDSDVY